jgi:uncharacterized membrane protein
MFSPDLVLNSPALSYQIEGGLLGNEGTVEFVLDVATGVFSFVLFVVTFYAWGKRSRQPTLLIVSLGFLSFFIEQVVGALPVPALHGELFNAIMDFVTLTLFFFALVVRPIRKEINRPERPESEARLAGD